MAASPNIYFTENSRWVLLKFARYIEGFFHTVNPLLSPTGGPFISGGRLNRDGGLNIFNLETTMVSVLHKELEYKVKKLKNKKF